MDEDSEDIYQTSLIDRYAARPDQLDHMCLAEFAANYTTHSSQEIPEDETIVTYCPELKMEKVDEVKASNLRMTLDACTNEGEKPLFDFTGLTKRKNQIRCI